MQCTRLIRVCLIGALALAIGQPGVYGTSALSEFALLDIEANCGTIYFTNGTNTSSVSTGSTGLKILIPVEAFDRPEDELIYINNKDNDDITSRFEPKDFWRVFQNYGVSYVVKHACGE